MHKDYKMDKYKTIFDTVSAFYSKYRSIEKACVKANISKSHYYNICKELGRKSVSYDGNRKVPVKITVKKKKPKKKILKEESSDDEDDLSDLEVDENNIDKDQKGGNNYVSNISFHCLFLF